MAEFASAIVGLAVFGAKVGDSLYGLIDTLKDAPAEFLALSDEVTDFRAIILQLLEASADFPRQRSNDGLDCARRNGEAILEEIGKLVQLVIKEKGLAPDHNKVDRVRWLRRVKTARKLQGLLRVQKATICNLLVLEILRQSSRQGLHISSLETKIDAISENQLSLGKKKDGIPAEIVSTNHIPGPSESNKRLVSDDSFIEPHTRAGAVTGKRLRNAPLACLQDCVCKCHFRTIVRSPRYLSDCLGDLILGCSSLPWCFSGFVPCNEQSCRRSRPSTSEMKFFLPNWCGKAIAGLSLTVNLCALPFTVNIHSRHTIPYDSPILVCTQEGDIEGIKGLLRSRTASINDVDPYGLGLLYYAVYYCWRASGKEKAIRTSQFLLDMGAHPEWEDEIGNTPLETMIDDTLVSLVVNDRDSCPPKSSDFLHISLLFDKPAAEILNDLVEDREFTTTHQIMLGIRRDLGTLHQYLSQSREVTYDTMEIDSPDARGRSPLAWAVEYGWVSSARTLLHFGANPHQTRQSTHGQSPLLHLAIAGPASDSPDQPILSVIQTLLQAGVDVNAVDHEGWTPLHVAASWNNYAIIKEIAAYGGDDLLWNILTEDGQSAVELALGCGFNHKVQRILAKHAITCGDIEETGYHTEDDSDEFVDCI